MATAECNYFNSGGGGEVVGIKETDVNYGRNEQFTIDTGLSQVKKFYGWFRSSTNIRNVLIQIDTDYIGSNKYNALRYQDEGTSFISADAGKSFSQANPNSTYVLQVEKIEGGVITFRVSDTSGNYPIDKMYWFAE